MQAPGHSTVTARSQHGHGRSTLSAHGHSTRAQHTVTAATLARAAVACDFDFPPLFFRARPAWDDRAQSIALGKLPGGRKCRDEKGPKEGGEGGRCMGAAV